MSDPRRGMTLTELLVATTIFVILGGALVTFLRLGLNTYRVGRLRQEAFERSQSILNQIESDLACTFADPSHGRGGRVDVMFLSGYDHHNRQYLKFVRTLAGEMRHPITQTAGSFTGGQFDIDYVNDKVEMSEGLLRPPGGLQEVAYVFGPEAESQMLWRGIKSPIGGDTTLFEEGNLYEISDDGLRVGLQRARPLAGGILYLEYNFWDAFTRAWRGLESTDKSAQEGLPRTWWDSTRALLPPGEEEEIYYDPESRHEWRDDIFPFRVQVTLVLRPARAVQLARLRRAIGEDDDEIWVDNTQGYPEEAFQYVLIDDEWIRYGSKTNRKFSEVVRGVRGTEPAEHERGARVLYGSTFSRVIRIPGGRHSEWRN